MFVVLFTNLSLDLNRYNLKSRRYSLCDQNMQKHPNISIPFAKNSYTDVFLTCSILIQLSSRSWNGPTVHLWWKNINLKATGAARICKIAGLIVQNLDFRVKPLESLCSLVLQLAWVCIFMCVCGLDKSVTQPRLVQELAVSVIPYLNLI